jgi:hypothetical protein
VHCCLAAVVLVIAATEAPAVVSSSSPAPVNWHFGVRADPVVFALGGFSVGVDAMPDDARWRWSLAAFAVEVPTLLVPLVAQPSRGVHVFEHAVQTGAFYDVADRHRGLYFGPELYIYSLQYDVDGQRLDAREAYAHVTVGDTWFPFDDAAPTLPVFVQPWATIGVPVFHAGGVRAGTTTIRDRVLNWHATVSLGVRW